MMDMAQTWSIEAFAEEIGGGFIGNNSMSYQRTLSVFRMINYNRILRFLLSVFQLTKIPSTSITLENL